MLAFEAMSPFHKFVRPLYMETKRKGNNLCLPRETKINGMANKDTRKKMLGNLIKLLFASKLFIVAKESIKELKRATLYFEVQINQNNYCGGAVKSRSL